MERINARQYSGRMTFSSALFLSTCLFARALGAESLASVTMELVSPEVYVGEEPVVRVTVTAASRFAVSVIRPERVHQTRSLRIDLLKNGAQRVPGGLPHFEARKSAEDFQRLEAGKTLTMYLEALSVPDSPGRYTVSVKLTPTPEQNSTMNMDLLLRCLDIPRNDIKDMVSVRLPDESVARDRATTVDIMNLRTAKGHELVFTRVEVHADRSSRRLRRICVLEPGSRIVATAKKCLFHALGYEEPSLRWEVWVAFSRGSGIHFARLDALTGQILEMRALGEPQENTLGAQKTETKLPPR